MNGAEFLRADLHIHSYGAYGSFDVKDITMTPQAIVDIAIEKGLKIISITDHNEILNSIEACNYAIDKDILVIPGIEVTTLQGHVLFYFPTDTALREFSRILTVSPGKDTTQQGILECMDKAEALGGISVLAHIDVDAGFERTIGKFSPQMEQIFCHKNLLGLEIKIKENQLLYTADELEVEGDVNPRQRKRLLALRQTQLSLDPDIMLAKLMSSDAHTLAGLGTNADGEKKLTRLKLDELNFHSFKIALMTPDSRVRLEEYIPESRPMIKSVKFSGGLLDKVEVNLSPNLTCIIGSRGTGKSTFLEGIKAGCGNNSDSRVVDSDVWPQTINIEYSDEAGQNISFLREKNDICRNLTDPGEGISSVDIEKYGQGETASMVQQSDVNPNALLIFLDDFINFGTLKSDDSVVIEKLLDNQSVCKKIRLDLIALDETRKALINNKAKLEKLQREKAGDLVKLQSSLIRERGIRSNLITDLKTLIKTYREIFEGKELFDNISALSDEEIVVGKDYLAKVKTLVAEFSQIVNSKSTELNEALTQKVAELNVELKSWEAKEKETLTAIELKKVELEAQGIPFDLGKINQISTEIVALDAKVRQLEGDAIRLGQLEKERVELIAERAKIKKEIFRLRLIYANEINNNLKNSLEGFFIKVEYHEGRLSQIFEHELKKTMDWRTSQVPKSNIIASKISPLQFVDFCRKNRKADFASITDATGIRLLSDPEIDNIISRCIKDNSYEDFETLVFDDLPTITVSKQYLDNGIQKFSVKQISQLSLGQQQSIMLAILMLSKSDKPLIIDQPEDNLDSEFIYKTIVKNLRKIKERRQVIIVTHNPNIAVLGDAELIVPLKSTNDKSFVIDDGSIDRERTRIMCCEILEGGKSAFQQRQRIYGI